MRILFSTAALAALLPAAASAEDVAEVVVTATRLPAPIEEVTCARVVDRAELEARAAPFAADVLATVPGVGVLRNGAFGGVATISIRGAAADKTLVLIDGVPVADPADPNGAFDAGALQASDMERVEVLSGPQGSLWGSDAIGGVVAFTTRELAGWRLEAEAGSFDTWRGFAGAGVASERHALNASLAAFRTDGISKAAGGAEKDGFETLTANAGGRLQLGAVKLDGRIRFTESDIDIDGYAPPDFTFGDTADRNKARVWSGVARGTAAAGGLTHTFSFSAYDLRRRSLSAFPETYTAERQVLRWTAQGRHVVFGAERQETAADLAGRSSPELSNTAAFAVGRLDAGQLVLTASLRHDDPEGFKARTTGRAALAADLGSGFTITASAGTGFKTPTISQAACDFCFAPPLALRPEKAEGYDLRLGWGEARVSAALTAYRLKVRDQIAYLGLRYENIARTRSRGLEAELDARLTETLRLKLAFAWMDAVDASTGRSLLRAPDRSGAASLFWNDGPWSGLLTVRGESSQTDAGLDGFSRVRRDGFVTAGVSAAYALSSRVSLTARMENITDERYQEAFGYGEPGRAVYVGVRLRN